MRKIEDIISLSNVSPAEEVNLLVQWAREHCDERKLYYDLVFLKSKFNQAFGNDDRLAIRNEMITFVQHFLDSQDTEKHAAAHEVIEEKRNHFIKRGASNEIIIECTKAGKKFPRTQFELKNINFKIRLGEITGVVGENGNGKTTLLRLLSGRLKNDSGHIGFNSKFIQSGSIDSVQREIGFLPQEPDKVYGKVLTSIRLSAAVHGIYGERNEFEVDYIIHRLGLTDYENVYWHELSGGYKVRFALARIMVRKPRVLILDEPLANLDYNAQNKLLADLRDLSNSLQYPVGVVISSQQLDEIESIADNMLYLSKGNVLYAGSSATVGSHRKENCYEIRTTLSRTELADRLKQLPQFRLEFTGITYLLTTSIDQSFDDILAYFSKHKIPVTYLNDISRSTKRILYKLNEASL